MVAALLRSAGLADRTPEDASMGLGATLLWIFVVPCAFYAAWQAAYFLVVQVSPS